MTCRGQGKPGVVRSAAGADCGLTIRGEIHGNVAHDGDTVALYDWSDAAVSHPFLDIVLLTRRLPEDEGRAAREVFTEAWCAAYPDVHVARALELAADANTIYQMVTFEQIYRAGGCVVLGDARRRRPHAARPPATLPQVLDG